MRDTVPEAQRVVGVPPAKWTGTVGAIPRGHYPNGQYAVDYWRVWHVGNKNEQRILFPLLIFITFILIYSLLIRIPRDVATVTVPTRSSSL